MKQGFLIAVFFSIASLIGLNTPFAETSKSHNSSEVKAKAEQPVQNSVDQEQEIALRKQIQSAFEKADFRDELYLQPGNFAKNITVSDGGFYAQYHGAFVKGSGQAFAMVPSNNTQLPVNSKSFRIIGTGIMVPGLMYDFFAYNKGQSFPISYVLADRDYRYLVLIVPRDIIPCEIELRGILKNRIELKK